MLAYTCPSSPSITALFSFDKHTTRFALKNARINDKYEDKNNERKSQRGKPESTTWKMRPEESVTVGCGLSIF